MIEVEKLKMALNILKECWKDIPELDCTTKGFTDRLFEDRNKRVIAFKEALVKVKELESELKEKV